MRKFFLRCLDAFDEPSAPTLERVLGCCFWALITFGNLAWLIAAFILYDKLS